MALGQFTGKRRYNFNAWHSAHFEAIELSRAKYRMELTMAVNACAGSEHGMKTVPKLLRARFAAVSKAFPMFSDVSWPK